MKYALLFLLIATPVFAQEEWSAEPLGDDMRYMRELARRVQQRQVTMSAEDVAGMDESDLLEKAWEEFFKLNDRVKGIKRTVDEIDGRLQSVERRPARVIERTEVRVQPQYIYQNSVPASSGYGGGYYPQAQPTRDPILKDGAK